MCWQDIYLANQAQEEIILHKMLFFKNYAILHILSPRKLSKVYYLYDLVHWKCIKILLQI